MENFFLYYKSIINFTVCHNVSSISKFNDLCDIFRYRICSVYIIRNLYKLSMTFENNNKYKRKLDISLFKLVTVFN